MKMTLQSLKPVIDVDQKHPRRYYVYAHLDSSEEIFYVGKVGGEGLGLPIAIHYGKGMPRNT